MAWNLFGGGEDEQQQGGAKKSFFSGEGFFSAIGSALKWLVVGAATILGVLYFSEGAKGFVDKHFDGAGTKALGMVKDGWDGLKGMLGFGPKDNAPKDPRIGTSASTSSVSGVDFPVARPEHIANPIFANQKDFEAMQNFSAAHSRQDRPDIEDGDKGHKLLNKRAIEALTVASNLEILGKDYAAFNEKYKGHDEIPKAPVIDLKIPGLSPDLNEYGAKIYKAKWESFTPMQKMGALVEAVKLPTEEKWKLDSLEKLELDPSDRNGITSKIKNNSQITKLTDVVTTTIDSPASPKDGWIKKWPDRTERFDTEVKFAIKTLHDTGRYGEAQIIADAAAGQFNKLLETAEVLKRTNTKEYNNELKEIAKKYNGMRAGMEGLRDQSELLKLQGQLNPILNTALAKAYEVATDAPGNIKDFNNKMAAYKKDIAEGRVLSIADQAEAAKQQAEKDRLEKEAKDKLKADQDRQKAEAEKKKKKGQPQEGQPQGGTPGGDKKAGAQSSIAQPNFGQMLAKGPSSDKEEPNLMNALPNSKQQAANKDLNPIV